MDQGNQENTSEPTPGANGESSSGLQQDLSNLTEERLRDLLEEVVDHQRPDSEKSHHNLLRRLNEETAATDDSNEVTFHSSLSSSRRPFLSGTASAPSSSTSRRGSDHGIGIGRKPRNNRSAAAGNQRNQFPSSHSLQDLAVLAAEADGMLRPDSLRPVGVGGNSSSKAVNNRKGAHRANSFTQQDLTTVELGQLGNERSASAAAGNCSNNNNSSSSSQRRKVHQQVTGGSKTSSASSNSANIPLSASSSVRVKDAPMSAMSAADTNDSNNNDSTCDEVTTAGARSQWDSAACSSSLRNMSSSSRMLVTSCDRAVKDNKLRHEDDETQAVEMQELGKRANFQRYSTNGSVEAVSPTEMAIMSSHRSASSSNYTSSSEVDRIVAFDGLKRSSTIDHFDSLDSQQFVDYFSSDSKHAASNRSASGELNDQQHGQRGQSGLQQPLSSSRQETKKKRTKPEEAKVLARDIEGHVGGKNIDDLVDYVIGKNTQRKINGNNSSKSATATGMPVTITKENGVRKDRKEKISPLQISNSGNSSNVTQNNNGGKDRHRKRTLTDCSSSPNESNSIIPVNSQERSKSVDHAPTIAQNIKDVVASASQAVVSPDDGHCLSPDEEARDTFVSNRITYYSPPTSPHQAPSESSFVGFASRSDELTDDEKGYHSDQDSGFQIPRTKRHRLRNKQAYADLQVRRSLPMNNKKSFQGTYHQHQPHIGSHQSATSSPLSTTPSAISVSSAAASVTGVASTSRGYESEREYTTDGFKRRQERSLRKVASSMPHSGQNSADNSDVDSSLSLPTTVRRAVPVEENESPAATVVSDVPAKISYADMAKAAVVATPTPTPNAMKQPDTAATATTPTATAIATEATTTSASSNGRNSSSGVDSGRIRPSAAVAEPVEEFPVLASVVPVAVEIQQQPKLQHTFSTVASTAPTPATPSPGEMTGVAVEKVAATAASVAVVASLSSINSFSSSKEKTSLLLDDDVRHSSASGSRLPSLTAAAPPVAASSPSAVAAAPASNSVQSINSSVVPSVAPAGMLSRPVMKKFNSIPEATNNKHSTKIDSFRSKKPPTASGSFDATTTTAAAAVACVENLSDNSGRSSNSTISLPAVVMYDEQVTATTFSKIDLGSSFTFGFFDDVVQNTTATAPIVSINSSTTDIAMSQPFTASTASAAPVNTQIQPSPLAALNPDWSSSETLQVSFTSVAQVESQVDASPNTNSKCRASFKVKPCPAFDVDLETFNYNEILNFIRQAWDNSLRDNGSSTRTVYGARQMHYQEVSTQ